MTDKLDANIVDLETLYTKSVSYRIPQFQRAYAWNKESQWEPLWEDVEEMANRELNRPRSFDARPHFMGAIVLQRQSNKTGEVEKRLVVDGQQRLTTLQLLIKATEKAFRAQNETDRANRLKRLTKNDDIHLAGDEGNDTKIRQSNQNDQTAFQYIVRDFSGPNDLPHSRISQGLNYFEEKVSDWLGEGDSDWDSKADALERTLTNGLKIAAIDLGDDQEPHVVFETLNERGEPLTQSDRIKNTVMYKADVIDDPTTARDLWGVFEDDWWRGETKEGRLTRTHNDRFLNYWVTMKTMNDVSSDKIAKEFRKYLDYAGEPPIRDIAEEIKDAGVFYRKLEEDTIPDMQAFLHRIKVLQLGVVTPILLWLNFHKITGYRLSRSLSVLESYLVRRTLCGYASMGLNRYFVDLLKLLEKGGQSAPDDLLIDQLSKATTDSQLWPNDRIVEETLTTKPLKGNAGRRTMILEAVESSIRTDKTEPLGATANLTLEHIMPQGWERHWQLPDPHDKNPELIERRKAAVGELGNLTLVTQKLNSSISNGPWSEKRQALDSHSSLFLNKTLLDDAPDVWDEVAIRNRSHRLAQQIIKIWPHAVNI